MIASDLSIAGLIKGQPSLLAVVAELELNSVRTTARHDRRGKLSQSVNPERHSLIHIIQLKVWN